MRTACLSMALWLMGSLLAPVWGADPAGEMTGDEFFERKIRPLLAQHCFSCHGRGQKKGGLGLDSREAILAGGESGAVAVPGKPEASMLLAVVTYQGDIQMPPSGKLTDDEIAALKQWLSLGMPWPATKSGASGSSIRTAGAVTDADRQFWSFQPIRDHAPPVVQQKNWSRNTLDHFILARLEAEGLKSVAEADRRTLIRRASFDLLGLPPTAEEIEAFVNDKSPAAYERLIDRLLESPHYGERWARHWLDVARYGEDQAHSFQARMYPSGYRYRDWIVDSFNRDLPFDQFAIAQIAGDLVEGSPRETLSALGFFALGPVYYGDAGCTPRARADEYDDRIDTLTRGFLGLTVSCARCHDHKFDPISMQDYYGLAGIFASSEYREAPLADTEVVKRYDELQAKIKQVEERQKTAVAEEGRKVAEGFATKTADVLVALWKTQQRRKSNANYKLSAIAKETGIEEYLLDRWLKHIEADAIGKKPLLAPWRKLIAEQNAKQDLSADPAALAATTEVAKQIESQILAAVEKRRAIETEYAAKLAALKPDEKKPNKPGLDKEANELLKELFEDRNAALTIPKPQVDKLLTKEQQASLATIQQEIDELKKQAGAKYPIAHSLTEGKPLNMQIHLRGNHKTLGDEAPRKFLAVLSPADAKPFAQGSGRLELARAIASPNNPLTARVFVNRVWQHHFGRGIVGTPSNFGLLGERPTHPELLDHLASRFIASGWSVKQLHRDIMLSATYRLASTHQAENYERDPDNRLLWRANRRRLDIESWRDAVLAACGNLDLTLGGPSLNLNDTNNRRRTFYASVSRHDLNSMLRLFDFPDPNLTSERRVITTVPMQQLFVLNSEFMIRQAKSLAERTAKDKPASDHERIGRLYRWVLGRAPSAQELQIAQQFLSAPLSPGDKPADVKLTPWEQLAQALLATNEFGFVD